MVDCYPKNGHSVIQYQRFDMNGLVCVFSKGVGSFRGNYLNLLFERQDVGISIFTGLSNFNSSSFKLEQSDGINFSASFLLKLSFGKQQIPKR